MRDFEIGIIGGTGGMGRWFADFLHDEGYKVCVSGRRSGPGMEEMAERCRVVVVSVPITVTISVIKQISPYMREKSLLMDLTSLKVESVKTMMENSVSEVIGCHPLFGPQVKDIRGLHIVLCPARADKWRTWLNELFEKRGALVLETTPEQHDAIMAVVQGLTHLNTIAMGLVLGKMGVKISALEAFTTPMLQSKLDVVEKVFCHNPRLYAEILNLNPGIIKVIHYYEEILAELKDTILKKDIELLVKTIEEHAQILFDKS
jgi:prephenate dehydrogenase